MALGSSEVTQGAKGGDEVRDVVRSVGGREGDPEARGPVGDGGGADGLNEEAAFAQGGGGLEGGSVRAEDEREDRTAVGCKGEGGSELRNPIAECGAPG